MTYRGALKTRAMREQDLECCLHLVMPEAPQVNEEVPVGVGGRRL